MNESDLPCFSTEGVIACDACIKLKAAKDEWSICVAQIFCMALIVETKLKTQLIATQGYGQSSNRLSDVDAAAFISILH